MSAITICKERYKHLNAEFQRRAKRDKKAFLSDPCKKYRKTIEWERLVGKPLGKASKESHRSIDPLEGKPDTAATAREEIIRACPHSRGGLTPLGRLQSSPRSMSALERNPQVLAPTPHKFLGTGMDRRGIPRGPEQLAWGLAFPEGTRARP